MQMVATPFYRPSSNERARCEDNHVITKDGHTALVADGVSRPYVGDPENYGAGKSSGEVVSQIICDTIDNDDGTTDLLHLLRQANKAIFQKHHAMGRDLTKEAVAGASVAGCQIQRDQVLFVTAGDSSIFWEDEGGYHVFTNFTSPAAVLEEAGNQFFEACKRFGTMVGAAPWQLYHPFFQAKQFFRANRNVDTGGHAMVNGNPNLEFCWSARLIGLARIKWILLVTDGMLWRDFRPEQHYKLVSKMFVLGGIPALIDLRDSLDNQPHITGWSEGTAIFLKPK